MKVTVFFAFSLLVLPSSASTALAQGTLAHIAAGGGWQTTITLLNLSPSSGTARITIHSDSGALLPLSAVNQPRGSQFTVIVPALGSASLVLNSPDYDVSHGWGWANIESLDGILIRGQGVFSYPPFKWSGAVPLTLNNPNLTSCLILPPQVATTILLPFDESNGSVVAVALANVSATAQQITFEADDEKNVEIVQDTFNLPALGHTAFTLEDRYSLLKGQKGIVRITASSQTISLLSFFVGTNNDFSTVLPVYQ